MDSVHVTRRGFLRASAASVLLAGSTSAGPEKRKNVLFIAVDDLNHSLGCYGHRSAKTPNIDRLAASGMRFDRAYCQYPVCNPSRSSLLSGLRPDSTGIFNNTTPFRSRLPDVVTLPQLFREAGYFTARLGKIFHSAGEFDDPKAWDATSDPRATTIGRKGQGRNLTDGQVKWCHWLAAEGEDEDQPDGQLAAEAIRFLEQSRDKPFFLGLGFHKPHDPFIAPKRYFNLYPLDQLTPPLVPQDASPLHPLAIASPWKQSFDRFTDQDRREFLRAYYAGVSFMDAQVGKVLQALDRLKLADNTIVLFFGDHGYHLGDHGWWNKNTLYEHSAHAPLLVVAPGETAPGTTCGRFVEFVDFYPTLADLSGLAAPAELEGRSFRPLLRQPDKEWKEAAFTQVQRGAVMGRTVRTDRWRYTEWDGGKQGAELYDQQNDPGEYHNHGNDPGCAAVRERMARLLRT